MTATRGPRAATLAALAVLGAVAVMASRSLGASLVGQSPVGTLTVVDLRCDGMTDPLGVDSTPPRLSWKLSGEGRGLRQSAWQVVVSSTAESLEQDHGDAWDSGRIASDEQLHVPYGGRPLRTAEAVWWKVRVWDGDGRVSAWSAPGRWTMGALTDAEWRAQWITDPELMRWSRPLVGYRSQTAADPAATKWLQVDLGESRPLERLRLHALRHTVGEAMGFPPRFKIEVADRPDLAGAKVVGDYTGRDYEHWSTLIDIPLEGVSARYVRLTATRLRVFEGEACLALSQVEVLSGGRNVVKGAAVTASDSVEEAPWAARAVTDGLGVPGANPRANDTLLLRRELDVRTGLRRALANVSGLGHYEMSVNGARVGTGLLTPAWTSYDKACLYDTYDVTALLRTGRNALGLLLGGGFYNVQEGRYHKLVTAFRPLTAIAQIRLEYDGGAVETVGTDERWRVRKGPIVFSNMYGGEDYDARRVPRGWDLPDFDDASWAGAVRVPAADRAVRGPATDRALRGASHASP